MGQPEELCIMAASPKSECIKFQEELHAAHRFLETGVQQLDCHRTNLAHTSIVMRDGEAQLKELRGLIAQIEREAKACWGGRASVYWALTR
jgi:hypothetical protein